MAVVEELQRMQDKDRRVFELLDQALRLLDAYPDAGSVPPEEGSGHGREPGLAGGKTAH